MQISKSSSESVDCSRSWVLCRQSGKIENRVYGDNNISIQCLE